MYSIKQLVRVEIDTMDELTFNCWNRKPGPAFSDICLATEMHLEGWMKEKDKQANKQTNKTQWRSLIVDLVLNLLAILFLDKG